MWGGPDLFSMTHLKLMRFTACFILRFPLCSILISYTSHFTSYFQKAFLFIAVRCLWMEPGSWEELIFLWWFSKLPDRELNELSRVNWHFQKRSMPGKLIFHRMIINCIFSRIEVFILEFYTRKLWIFPKPHIFSSVVKPLHFLTHVKCHTSLNGNVNI